MGADGRELNDGLGARFMIEPPPRFPNDGDGAICGRLGAGAGALDMGRDTWPELPRPPNLP